MDLSPETRGALSHAPQSVAAAGRLHGEAISVVPYAQPERTVLHAKQDLRFGAAGVADDIVHRFFQHQQELSAQVRIELYIFTAGGFETELNVAGSQNIGRKAAHPVGEIAKLVPLGIDRPNDIAHGLDDFS